MLALILSPPGRVAVIVLQHIGYVTGQDRFVEQTVPFSHKHHAGELGIARARRRAARSASTAS